MKTIEKSYSKESFERWGDISAYREHEQKDEELHKREVGRGKRWHDGDLCRVC